MELIIYALIIGTILLQRNAFGWIDEARADSQSPAIQSLAANEPWNDIVQRFHGFVDASRSPDPTLNEESSDEIDSADNNDIPYIEEELLFQDPLEPGWNERFFDEDNDEFSNSPRVESRRRRYRRFPSRLGGNYMDGDDSQDVSREFSKDTVNSYPQRENVWNSGWRPLFPRRVGLQVNKQASKTQNPTTNGISDNQQHQQQIGNEKHGNWFTTNEENFGNSLTENNAYENRPSERFSESRNEPPREVSSLIEDHPSNFLSDVVKNNQQQQRENTAVQQRDEKVDNFRSNSPETSVQLKRENSVYTPIDETQGTDTKEPLNARKSRNVNNDFEGKDRGKDGLGKDNLKSNNLEKNKNLSDWEKILPRRDQFRVNWGRYPKHDESRNQSTRKYFPIARRGWKVRNALLHKAQKALEQEEYLDKESMVFGDSISWKEKLGDKTQLEKVNIKDKQEKNTWSNVKEVLSSNFPTVEMKDEQWKSNLDNEGGINVIKNQRSSLRNMGLHPIDNDEKENDKLSPLSKGKGVVTASKADLSSKEIEWRKDKLRPAGKLQFEEEIKNSDRDYLMDMDEQEADYKASVTKPLRQNNLFPDKLEKTPAYDSMPFRKGYDVSDNLNNKDSFHKQDQDWGNKQRSPENHENIIKDVTPSHDHNDKDNNVRGDTQSVHIYEEGKKIDSNGNETKRNSSVIDWRDQFMKQVNIGMEWAKESLRKDLKSETSTTGNAEEGKPGDWVGQLQNQIFSRAGLSKQPLKGDAFPLGNTWTSVADTRKNVGELRDLWGRQITKAKHNDLKNKIATRNRSSDGDSKNLLSILEKDKDRKSTESTVLEGRRDAWEKQIIESDHFLTKKYEIPQRTTMGDLRDKWQKEIVNDEDLMSRTFPKYNKPHYDELMGLAMKRLSSRASQDRDESAKNTLQEKFKYEMGHRHKQPKQKRSLVFNAKEADFDNIYGTKNNLNLTEKNKTTETALNGTQKAAANANRGVINNLTTYVTTTAPIFLDKVNKSTTTGNQSKNRLLEKDATQNKKSLNGKPINPSSDNLHANVDTIGMHFPNNYVNLETKVPQYSMGKNETEVNSTNSLKGTTPLPKPTKFKSEDMEIQEKPLANRDKIFGEPLDLTFPGINANAKQFTERNELPLDTKVFTLASQLPDQPKSIIGSQTDFQYESKNFPPSKPYFTEESEPSLADRHLTDPILSLKRKEDNINQQNYFDETNSYSPLQQVPQITKTVLEDKDKNFRDWYFTGTDLARNVNDFQPSKTYTVKSEPIPVNHDSPEINAKGLPQSYPKVVQDKDLHLGRHFSYDRDYATETKAFQKLTDSIHSSDFSNASYSDREVNKLAKSNVFHSNVPTTNKPVNEYYKNDAEDRSNVKFVPHSETSARPEITQFLSDDSDPNADDDLTRGLKQSRMFNSMHVFGPQADEFLGSKRTVKDRGILTPKNDEQDVGEVTEFPLELDAGHQKMKPRRRNGEDMIRFLTKMLDDKPIVIPKRFGKVGKNYGNVLPQENEQKLQELEEEKRKGSKLLAMAPKINARKFYDTLASVLAADRNVWQRQFVENPFADVVLGKFKEYLPIAFKQTKMNTSYSIKYPKSQELDLTITNVIGVLPGRKEGLPTDEFTIIGAHYDSADNVENSEEFHNSASGITLLLEILRVLASSEWQLENSIYFVAFDLGEVDRVGSSHFVKHYLVPKVIESGRGTLKGAYILNTLMAYNSTPDSQRLPYEVTEFAPGVAGAVSKEENRGDFYLVSARKSVDSELAEKLSFYWSLMPNPNFKIHVAQVNLTEVKRHKMHSIFNDGDHRNFWDAGEAQDHVLKAVHVGDTEYARASGECFDTDCQAFSPITPSSLLFVKKLGEALIATLLDFGGGILAEFRTPLRRRAILPPGRTRRIRRGRYANQSPQAIGFRIRRSHHRLT